MMRRCVFQLAAKDVRFGADVRQKILRGVDEAARAISATLGPQGRNVAIASEYGDPKITKDGVTVAKALEAECAFENIGVRLVRQACSKTNDIAGDGTTATAVLVQAIFAAGHRCVARGTNAIDMKRGIDKAVEVLVAELARSARVIQGNKDVVQVATISANGDAVLGSLIGEALAKVGKDGVITTQDGKTLQTELELVEGMSIDRGFISAYFVTDPKTQKAEFEDAAVLVSAKKLSSVQTLLPLLNHAATDGRALLIIADDVDGDALTTLIYNRLNGKLRVVCVKAPGFGDNKTAMLQDIAVFTGAQVVGDDTGVSLDPKNMDPTILGSVKKVTVDKDKSILLTGGGSSEVVRDRVDLLRQLAENETSEYNREKLQERLAKLTGGVGVIKVGGASEVEVNEKKDRITDALCATRAAIQEGIVAGGGAALLHASKALDKLLKEDTTLTADQRVGVTIVRDAARQPVQRIAANAGKEGAVVVEKLLETADAGAGYDALRDRYVNMFEAGIIDPTRVVRASLVDAASVAGLMMTTEAAVCDLPKKDAAPTPGMGGMGGMGGMDY